MTSKQTKFWTIGAALSRVVNIPRSTIGSAIRAGHCESWQTQCGVTLTTTEAVQRWQKKRNR